MKCYTQVYARNSLEAVAAYCRAFGAVATLEIFNESKTEYEHCELSVEQMPRSSFDIHAGAFEPAMAESIDPGLVRTEKTEGLLPNSLSGQEIDRWQDGEKKDIGLIPQAYCGDPEYHKFLHFNMEKIYHNIAESIISAFGSKD